MSLLARIKMSFLRTFALDQRVTPRFLGQDLSGLFLVKFKRFYFDENRNVSFTLHVFLAYGDTVVAPEKATDEKANRDIR